MTYLITGATGQFGRLVIDSLLEREVPPGDIIATGRNVARLSDLAGKGVQVRVADYDDIDSLRAAFDGASKMLLVSGTAGQPRVAQHQNAIDAATDAGVELVAYTSVANADLTTIKLASDHQHTELALTKSGLPHVLLRNNMYLEMYTDQLPVYLRSEAVVGSAGDGRQSSATRADLAEAAAIMLLSDNQAGKVYELGGDEAFTFSELAAAIAEAAAQPITYKDLPAEEYAQLLVSAGVPELLADTLADAHLGIAGGELVTTSGDLHRLLGRRPTSMPDAVRAAVQAFAGKEVP